MVHAGVLLLGSFPRTQTRQQMHHEVLYPPPLCRVGRPLNLRFKVGSLKVFLGFSVKTEHAHQNRVRPPFRYLLDQSASSNHEHGRGIYIESNKTLASVVAMCGGNPRQNYDPEPSKSTSKPLSHCADRFHAVIQSRFVLRRWFQTDLQAVSLLQTWNFHLQAHSFR